MILQNIEIKQGIGFLYILNDDSIPVNYTGTHAIRVINCIDSFGVIIRIVVIFIFKEEKFLACVQVQLLVLDKKTECFDIFVGYGEQFEFIVCKAINGIVGQIKKPYCIILIGDC